MNEPASTVPIELSLVVCLYFEEECVEEFIRQVNDALKAVEFEWELVFVDDGSRDRTVEIVTEIAASDPRIKLVVLSRNHGKEAAITAGISHVSGEVMILMDPDLQDPPDRILDFYEKCKSGYDLVWGIRQQQSRGISEALTSAVFWRTLRGMTGLPIPVGVAVMRSFSRRFAEAFLQFPESNRFIEGVFASIGLKTTTMKVENRPRFAGQSKFNFRKRMQLAFRAITAFSERPLMLTVGLGVFGLIGSLALASFFLIRKVAFDVGLLGWTSTVVVVVFMGSLNLVMVGLTGLYVGRIYREVKGRPLFLVQDRVNVRQMHSTGGAGNSSL